MESVKFMAILLNILWNSSFLLYYKLFQINVGLILTRNVLRSFPLKRVCFIDVNTSPIKYHTSNIIYHSCLLFKIKEKRRRRNVKAHLPKILFIRTKRNAVKIYQRLLKVYVKWIYSYFSFIRIKKLSFKKFTISQLQYIGN